ncbi:MAG: hypothetical protein Rpha_1783 [Candidatus Ruthia sp. Apha_13_S6]|nr:hypothetical protein [Candidatus Ruthia sp. Apha_13_S6]
MDDCTSSAKDEKLIVEVKPIANNIFFVLFFIFFLVLILKILFKVSAKNAYFFVLLIIFYLVNSG